jgi:non-lysosomal glucosylceramidase
MLYNSILARITTRVRVIVVAVLVAVVGTAWPAIAQTSLSGLPERDWVSIHADGYSEPAVAVVFRDGGQRRSGIPLGGLGTGYVSLGLDGNLQEWTIFNNLFNPEYGLKTEYAGTWVGIPRRLETPFLGVAIDGNTSLLSLQKLPGLGSAKQIHYWGHYPIADLQYELEAPLDVSLCAYSPFVLGDPRDSNIPAAIFAVTVRNRSEKPVRMALVMSIPSPEDFETGGRRGFSFEKTQGVTTGLVREASRPADQAASRRAQKYGYCIAAIDEPKVRVGGPLLALKRLWENVATTLPEPSPIDAGSSLAVDFSLDAGQQRTVRLVMAWYAPDWPATPYSNVYAKRYAGAFAVAKDLAARHAEILQRIRAWQQCIYAEQRLPMALRDGLINSLCVIAKCSSYVDGPGAEGGLLVMMEAMGNFLIQETTCVAWWGDFPLTYFFPELRRDTLRQFARWQDDQGRIPFSLGSAERSFNVPNHTTQQLVNGILFTQMVDRLAKRMNDPSIGREFYPAIKKAIIYTMTQSINDDGLVGLDPNYPTGQPWDGWHWKGNATYIAGHWLCSLQIAKDMADRFGDRDFAEQCADWIQRGGNSLEKQLWNPSTGSYLLYAMPGSDLSSDSIFAYQLDASFSCSLNGVKDVFPPARRAVTLATIKEKLVAPCPVGAFNGIRPDGSLDLTAGGADSAGIWPASNAILAAIYAYQGDVPLAQDILNKTLINLHLEQQLLWQFPQGFYDQQGSRPRASDYYWGMSLWATVPALLSEDITEFAGPNGFAGRVLASSRAITHRQGPNK